MHRRWDVSLLGVGMERFRRLYHSWGMCAGTYAVAKMMRWGGNGMKN